MANRTGTSAGWLFAVTHWNWKVALLTAVLRGAACVAALWNMEFHARRHFGIVEACFVLVTCGFFSALQQQSLELRPELLAWLICVVVVPLTSLGCDAGVHLWLDGGATRRLGWAGVVFTIVSATFHWHMIRNGALLVGKEEVSLGADLRRIPRLLGTYFAGPVVWMRKAAAATGAEAEESAVA